MSGAWSNDQLNSLFIYDTTGALILTVTENGITYIAPARRFDMYSGAFQVAAEPSDGSYVQLTTNPALGGVIFIQPVNSAVVGASFFPSTFFVDEQLLSPTNSQPVVAFLSPTVNGQNAAQLVLRGESSAGTDNREFEVDAEQWYANGTAIGTGWVNGGQAGGNFGPIGNTDTIYFTAPQMTYKAGHAYDVRVTGQATVSAAPNRPVWRIRQSSDGATNLGTQAFADGKPHVNTGMHDACFSCKFGIGAADVTTYVVLSMTSASGAFTVTGLSSANQPFQFDIYDIGLASNHPGITIFT